MHNVIRVKGTWLVIVVCFALPCVSQAILIDNGSPLGSFTYLNQWNRVGPVQPTDPATGRPPGFFANDAPVKEGEQHFFLTFNYEDTRLDFDLTGTGFGVRQILVTFDWGSLVFDVMQDLNFDDTFVRSNTDQNQIETTQIPPPDFPSISHITHVTLYGSRVPESGRTLLLLGISLGTLAGVARTRSKRAVS